MVNGLICDSVKCDRVVVFSIIATVSANLIFLRAKIPLKITIFDEHLAC